LQRRAGGFESFLLVIWVMLRSHCYSRPMNTKLNLHHDASITLVRSYSDGILLIADTEYTCSTIVTSQGCRRWALSSIESLTSADFAAVFELGFRPELVLLGTGKTLQFPSAEQTRTLLDAQIGLEVMDTAAACRTYNILADDGRQVVACLLV
jgi:uncharacterized protein